MPTLIETEFPTNLPTKMYLGDSGIVLGNSIVDDYGCRWRWTSRNAWGNKPAPREEVGDRAYESGQWDASAYYGPRTLSVPGHCLAPSHADLHAAEQRLRNAVGVGGLKVRITEPGYDSWAMMRQTGEIVWNEINPKVASFSLGLYAPDPRIWSSLERDIGPILFPAITGGLVWPATWPANWNATVVFGSEDLVNPGNEPLGLQLRIDGPVDWMALDFPDLGQTQYLENPDGPLLTTGQWIDLDTETRQLLLNGDAHRRSWTYGDWLTLPPATSTTLSIRGNGTTTDSKLSGSYRTARI